MHGNICTGYELKVTTIPAHESRLYWEYQHVVHEDQDPFADDDEPATACASVAVAQTTNEDASAADQQANNSSESSMWGCDKAPAGWRERADRMLLKEYQHLPAKT